MNIWETFREAKIVVSFVLVLKKSSFCSWISSSKLPTDRLSLLPVIPVSIMNGEGVIDTYALIDPGCTLTGIIRHTAKSIHLKTDRKINMNVHFMKANKSLPVSRTNFTLAPYADNDTTFLVQIAFCTDNINLSPPADINKLNTVCLSPLSSHETPEYQQRTHRSSSRNCLYSLHIWIRGTANHPSGIRNEHRLDHCWRVPSSQKKKSRPIKSLIFYASAHFSHEQSLSASLDVDLHQHFLKMGKTAAVPPVDHIWNKEEQ